MIPQADPKEIKVLFSDNQIIISFVFSNQFILSLFDVIHNKDNNSILLNHIDSVAINSLDCYCVITVNARPDIQWIHDRMPAILDPKDVGT